MKIALPGFGTRGDVQPYVARAIANEDGIGRTIGIITEG